jgi:uncharacterized protein YecT (DUF1311 family)
MGVRRHEETTVLSASCIAACLLLAAAAQAKPCDSIKTDDLITCSAAELKSEEAILADVLKRVYASLADGDRWIRETYGPNPPPELERKGTDMLDTEQAAWLRYRDAACERRTHRNLGGRERPIYVLACRAQLTRERIEDLRRELHAEPTKPNSP